MSVAVIVPWRPTPDRLAAWTFLERCWGRVRAEWRLTTCDHGGDWFKGEAVALGVRASFEDVLVIADADVWCDGTAMAVDAVQNGAPWAVPHTRILRLAAAASEAVLSGEAMQPTLGLERPPHPAVSGGGLVVMRRDVFEACPMPLLKRREDEAWQTQLVPRFGRPWRGTADLYHLYHEPAGVGDG